MKKYDLRVQAFGTVDETNAALGLARLHSKDDPEIDVMLARIQNDLFDLGADLCTLKAKSGKEALRMIDAQVARLESEIDQLNENLAAACALSCCQAARRYPRICILPALYRGARNA